MSSIGTGAAALLAAAAPWAAAAAPAAGERYLYYLHGKIVEDSGPRGVSPRFGAYDYPGIVAALRKPGVVVVSEIRPRGTDPSAYADKVVRQIRAQLRSGIPASHITVVGASKGSVIASLVSTRLQVRGVRYVLLANCNDWLIRTWHPRLSGEVLSIYEASDDVGGSCRPVVRLSPAVTRFREIRLNTGLGHGVVYRPLPQWVGPATSWATR
ncbi:MAG: alpha/beta hydrolase [Bacillota bacterium]